MIRSRSVALLLGLSVSVGICYAAAPLKTLKITEKNASLLKSLERYPDLESLSISCIENLRALPDSVGKLTKLKELIIDNGNGCSMNPLLPESIGSLRVLEKLVLYGAQDPGETDGHPPVQPKERHKFPEGLSQLTNLTYLDLGRNSLDEIPTFVKDLPQLRELRFQWNGKLKAIPSFLASLGELRILMLDADGLKDLPNFLNTLPNLTRVTLGDNCSITQSAAKKRDLKRRFPKITFDFTDEYDCPGQ
jgi:Leucine-rich repeat (LRR) protein